MMTTLSPMYPRRGANAKAAIGVIPPFNRIWMHLRICGEPICGFDRSFLCYMRHYWSGFSLFAFSLCLYFLSVCIFSLFTFSLCLHFLSAQCHWFTTDVRSACSCNLHYSSVTTRLILLVSHVGAYPRPQTSLFDHNVILIHTVAE